MIHYRTKRYKPSDNLDTYSPDDWRDVSQSHLPKSVLIKCYKKIDWMFYAMHTNVSALNLPDEIMNYIIDDVMVGESVMKAFDDIQ